MVLLPANASEIVVGIHIIGVMVAFGVTFTYPVFALIGTREPQAMPSLHRLQVNISRMVITPGLLVILAAGIYLASDEHQWSAFYVQWGLAAVIVLAGVEHAFIAPRARRLAELAERDLGPGGGGLAARGPTTSEGAPVIAQRDPATAEGGPAIAQGDPATVASQPTTAGGGHAPWSDDYNSLFRRVGAVGALLDLIVIVTIFFMATRLGA